MKETPSELPADSRSLNRIVVIERLEGLDAEISSNNVSRRQ